MKSRTAFTLLPGGGGTPGQVRHRREPLSHVTVRPPVTRIDPLAMRPIFLSAFEATL